MDIFEKVAEINLPDESYVVVGGGVLVALELLEWDEDIDLCVTPELFEDFQAKGWQQEEWGGKPVLRHDIYDVGIGFGTWSLEDLQADAQIIKNVPFMSLGKLLQWKQDIGRPKDLEHIGLIEHYLQGNESTSIR